MEFSFQKNGVFPQKKMLKPNDKLIKKKSRNQMQIFKSNIGQSIGWIHWNNRFFCKCFGFQNLEYHPYGYCQEFESTAFDKIQKTKENSIKTELKKIQINQATKRFEIKIMKFKSARKNFCQGFRCCLHSNPHKIRMNRKIALRDNK